MSDHPPADGADGADRCGVVYVHVESEERRSSGSESEERRSSGSESEERRSSGSESEERRSSASDGAETTVLAAPEGATLRDVLRDAGHSPYTRLTERANCGGRGLCATCGVRLADGPAPEHWHDALAARWGYPRLSCQVTLDRDVRVWVPEKLVWGGRE